MSKTRRYFVKVEVCGRWIPATALVMELPHHYATLTAAESAAAQLRDGGYKTRIDVVSN